MAYVLWLITLLVFIISFHKNKVRTLIVLRSSFSTLKMISSNVLGMIGLIGVILAIFPQEKMAIIFASKGLFSFVIVSLLGAIVTIPGVVAFPLAGSLLKIGASKALLASFLTTLTMVGIVSSPMEIFYFGRRFTIMRQALSFIAAVIIGLIMGAIL